MLDTDADTLAALQQAVTDAQEAFRAALTAWKAEAKAPPLFLHDRVAPPLNGERLRGAQVWANRHDMLRDLATGPIGAEVGVQHGQFSRFILTELRPDHLHLFDRGARLIRDDVQNAPNITLHLGDSSRELSKLPDASLDWIYIDADHSYDGVSRDIRAARDKVKPGGAMIFNDYTPWSVGEALPYGVIAAVNELVNAGHDMLGVALTPSGYFDVALRR